MRRLDPDPKGKHVPGVPLDKEKIKELIIEHEGNLTQVARVMQCARRSIHRIINVDPEMQEIVEEARERVLDHVESAFYKKVKSGEDTKATIFFLKCRGRKRGYDHDLISTTDSVARAAINFALNLSRNPAEKELNYDEDKELQDPDETKEE